MTEIDDKISTGDRHIYMMMVEMKKRICSGHIAPGLNGQCVLPPCMLPPMLGAVSAAAVAVATASVVGPPISTPLPSVTTLPSMNITAFDTQSILGLEIGKKRKRRTSFTPQALEVLNRFFERNTHPTGTTRSIFRSAFAFRLSYFKKTNLNFQFTKEIGDFLKSQGKNLNELNKRADMLCEHKAWPK
jgi:hypothetical protein